MADGREPARLHPADIAEITRALQRGPTSPVVPPPDATGIDARVISEAVRAIVGEKVSAFLTREQIRDLIDERLGRIGLRMDEDRIDQTADDLRGSMKWHRWASKTWMAALGTVALGAVYALMKKVGLPVPAP